MADTIKEFLVALGFKVDDAGLNKFETGIGRATKVATGLGTAIAGAAVAIEVAVAKVAGHMEELYYTSQRTDAAVNSLNALEFAARNIGLQAGQATGAVEGLARSMRMSPGIGAMLGQMGIATEGRDTVKVLDDVLDRLRRMPFYIAARYGQLLGIDPDTLLMMMRNLDRARASAADFSRRQREAGVDAKALAATSTEFGRAWAKLESDVEIYGQALAQKVLPAMIYLVGKADELVQWFNRLNVETNGWASVGLAAVVGGIGAWIAKAVLLRVVMRGVAAETVAAGAEAAVAVGLFGRLFGIIGTGLRGLGWLLRLGLINPLTVLLASTVEANAGEDEAMKAQPEKFGRTSGRAKGGARVSLAAGSDAMKFFEGKGWSHEAAAGITANLEKESGFDPTALGDGGQSHGIGQWNKERFAALQQFAASRGKEWTDYQTQLAFVHHELTEGADKLARVAGAQLRRPTTTARQAGEIFSRLDERPRDTEAEAAARGQAAEQWAATRVPKMDAARLAPSAGAAGGAGAGEGDKSVTLHQTTTVHVAPGPDAKETAGRVGDAQTRVNADIARNMQGAVR